MAKKMLIDATHAEETRVVVVDGNKVDEFDFETVNKRQLAGNIYLAKVTRVERESWEGVDRGLFEGLRELRHEDWVADNSAICAATGWQPATGLEQGLQSLTKSAL